MSSSTDSQCDIQLSLWLESMRAGDPGARDRLLQTAWSRLERLARKMLRGFSRVQRWEETADVLQNSMVRLLRALQHVQPASLREFIALATEQIRRELIDLARHYQGPQGLGANYTSAKGDTHVEGGDGDAGRPLDPIDPRAEDPSNLEAWCAFHEAVALLPAQEREAFGLLFYQGWTQVEVAGLLEVNVRTVRRWWQNACLQLHAALGENTPEF